MSHDTLSDHFPRLPHRSGSSPWLRAANLPPRRYPRPAEVPVDVGSPALHVLTDFSWELPSTTESHKSIDEALQRMIAAGVRALLVVRDDHVLGLITAYDIQGERPLQTLKAFNYTRHDEIEVGDIMTPWSALSTLDWSSAEMARVHYLEEALGRTRASHVLLIERDDYDKVTVRGLLSRRRLERQLGRATPQDSMSSSSGDTQARNITAQL